MIRNRYRRITGFFAPLLLKFAFWDLLLPRLGLRRWAAQTRPARLRKAALAFRQLAVRMGGVLIKVGQFLSTRVDVLPAELTEELAGLQDEVPAEKFEDIRRVAESEYGMSLGEKFYRFEEQAMAAASLGQVHRACISPAAPGGDGDCAYDVVVKVQRPNIEAIITTDLAAINTVGRWLQRYEPIRRRADIPALLGEFARILLEEIDYLAEGRNAETFAANFKDDPRVRVPQVIWTHTTRRALTLENVMAIKITDYQAITAANIDRAEVASRLLDTYLKQIFTDGFFHADPHPGNLFVSPRVEHARGLKWLDEEDKTSGWQLTFIDFGMVGRVPPHTKEGLRELLIGVGTQDSARVVKAYKMLDILLPEADLELIEKAEARVFEQFWGKSMSELRNYDMRDAHQFAEEFRDLIRSMPFQVPQDFIFLGRTVGILSGMCTGLDPEFNVWTHLAPFAQQLIAEEARSGAAFWLDEIKTRLGAALSIPLKMDAILAKLERGEIAVRSPELGRQISRLEASMRQLAGAVLFAAFLLGGVQLYLGGQALLAGGLALAAALSLGWALLAARR
ncbi:MAG: AarF/UbiB family protein [Chloroflexi bacterium]|nr:AarF/UbiB family protein [Chloroflexota bacterium]